MKQKSILGILPAIIRAETLLLPAVSILSAVYIVSYLYIYRPGTSTQQITYWLLGKIGESTGLWQTYNVFHYTIGISEKALAISAYALAVTFSLALLHTQRTSAAATLRTMVSVLMLKGAGHPAFPALVVAYGAATAAEYFGMDKRGPEIRLKNSILVGIAKWTPLALLLASIIPAIAVPYGLDVSLSSAAWTHYKNAISIYETGLPLLGNGFFDTRFAIYPPMSHYILVVAKAASGRSILETLKASYALFSALTLLLAYLLAREVSGGWYAAIVAAYAGLNTHLLGASFFGNYAELVSSAMAGGSLFFIARYEKHNGRGYLAASAALFALTVSTHWLFAMVLTVFFTLYFALIRRKDALWFLSIAALALLPYMMFLAAKAGSAQGIAWIFQKYPTNQPCDIGCMLLPTFLPFNAILPQGDWMLLVLGAVGLVAGARIKLMRIPLMIFAISLLGFYLLRDYLTFFYPNRLLWVTKFYFAYFIGYGIYASANECIKKNRRAGALIVLALICLLAAANIYDQISHIHTMEGRKQALAIADRDAVLWIKENSNVQDIVVADALRLETVYGFTKARITQPPQAAQILASPEKGSWKYLVYISSPEGACKFPCTDAIQLRKNDSLVRAWDGLSFERTKEAFLKSSRILFEEENTYVFRVK